MEKKYKRVYNQRIQAVNCKMNLEMEMCTNENIKNRNDKYN